MSPAMQPVTVKVQPDRWSLREAAYAVLLGGAMVAMFVLLVVTARWGQVEADGRHRAESTLEHVVRSCQQRADGSAVCPANTFTPLTATTTVAR